MIWDAITAIIPGGWLAAAAAGIAALAAAWWRGRRSGAEKAEKQGLRETVKSNEVRNEVENRIAADRSNPVDRVREKWGRDQLRRVEADQAGRADD